MSLWICLRWPESGHAPDTNALHRLALAMLRYSPRVACFRGDSVVLEVAASLALFKGPSELCRRIRHTASGLPHQTSLGMAPSATGAWLLAAAPPARRRVLRTRSLARRLAGLPLCNLPETLAYQPWLESIGCHNLGSLRRLPRQGLQQRSSPALLHALDAAHAQVVDRLTWFTPPARFRQAFEPDFHLRQASGVLAAAQPLLLALCGWLQSHQHALHDFVLILHHEKGRSACPPTRLELRFSAATWNLEDFNRVLKERLQHCALRQAVIRLELLAGPAHRRAPANDTLFPDPSRHTQEEQRLLDLLAARLGDAGIRRPRPRPQHLPEQANLWETSPCPPSTDAMPASVGMKARPFWLLPQPQLLAVRQERPVHQGRALRLVHGPERIETGWHAASHQRRDYFVAEDATGTRYWIYRERETGDSWFLHGLFA